MAMICMAFAASASFARAQEQSPYTETEAKLYEAAKQEGSVTWYVSQTTTENADKSCAGFKARYPGIECNAVRASGQVIYQRIQQELGANALQADVTSTNDEGQMVQLKEQGALLQYKPDNLQYMVPVLRDLGDKENYWFTSSVSPIIMTYNTNLVSKEEAPTNWTDLYDPKWKNQIAIGHPGFSGSVGLWTVLMDKLYGWDFFDKLEKNGPQIGRSIADGHNLVVSGERKVAISPLAMVLQDEMLKGAPVAKIFPTDGALFPPSATAILKDAPHPNAAKLFAEFFLSKENSVIFAETYRYPLRADVPPAEGHPPIDSYKSVAIPAQEGIEKVQDVQAKFRDTFGI